MYMVNKSNEPGRRSSPKFLLWTTNLKSEDGKAKISSTIFTWFLILVLRKLHATYFTLLEMIPSIVCILLISSREMLQVDYIISNIFNYF